MPDDGGVVRRVAWREIMPWLILFRAFRISISPAVLLLATVGWLLTPLGSLIGEVLFLGQGNESRYTWLPTLAGFDPWGESIELRFGTVANPILFPYRYLLLDPILATLDPTASIGETAYHVLRVMWNVGVWAFFGVAIIRIAAVQLGREERTDLGQASGFAAKHYPWSVTAPLFPLLGLLLLGAGIAFLGLIMRADIGVLLAALVWPLVLLAGVAMAMLLLGLLAGWPLMWPTVACEQYGDAFEAFSRSFSYVFQRPLRYIFYLSLAVVLGMLGWLLVSAVSETIIHLTMYAASWGASHERIAEITYGEHDGLLWAGAGLINAFHAIVRIVAVAFHFSFFFCSVTAIYLILRRDVDETDIDEVFVQEERDSYNLPPLTTNADGVPEVAEPEGENEAAEREENA